MGVENVQNPIEADVAHVFHPMSVLASVSEEQVLIFEHAQGLRVTDISGTEYLDSRAGMANVNIGYGREELAEVAAESMRRLSYAKLFYGQGSPSAARLAAKLREITPTGIERLFFTVGGSDANDSVIKMVRYFNASQGRPEKVKIIGRKHSYHGMTLGALSLTGGPEYWKDFGPLVPGIVHIEQPEATDKNAAQVLEEAILREGPETVAAFVAEPISVPARYVMPPPGYWAAVRAICTKYDVLLVSDEVITGFGRTGTMFAADHWNIQPDVIVMSKGLTSGYLPLGAVGVSEALYDGIAARAGMFMHGFTGGGHPVACDVALRNIEIIEDESLVENAAKIGGYLREQLEDLAARHSYFGEVRGIGMLQAIDVNCDPPVPAYSESEEQVAASILAAFRKERLLGRVYGQTIGFCPSLCATSSDIDEIVSRVERAVSSVFPHRGHPVN